MNLAARALLIASLVLSTSHCNDPPKVVQGIVMSYDAASKTIVVLDEDPPHASFTLDAQGADMGTEPGAGDKVRIAYRSRGNSQIALRIMGLSVHTEAQ